MTGCACGEPDCPNFACGYPWCRPCAEHHRPPECPVDETGEPLAPCGCTWAETQQPGYYDRPCRHDLAARRELYEQEPDEPDLGLCPWYMTRGRPDRQRGTCTFGCVTEPACETSPPDGGWPSEHEPGYADRADAAARRAERQHAKAADRVKELSRTTPLLPLDYAREVLGLDPPRFP